MRLRQNRGEFLVRRQSGVLDIVARGRGDWSGWLELEREPVDDTAMRMTAQVIRDVGADVIGVVEAENRPALKGFSDTILPLVGRRALRAGHADRRQRSARHRLRP